MYSDGSSSVFYYSTATTLSLFDFLNSVKLNSFLSKMLYHYCDHHVLLHHLSPTTFHQTLFQVHINNLFNIIYIHHRVSQSWNHGIIARFLFFCFFSESGMDLAKSFLIIINIFRFSIFMQLQVFVFVSDIPENNDSTGAACPFILNIMVARRLNEESNFDIVFQNEIGSRPSMKSFSLVAIHLQTLDNCNTLRFFKIPQNSQLNHFFCHPICNVVFR